MPPQSSPPTRLEAIALATARGQPLELVEVEIGDRVQRVFKNAPRCLHELYAQTVSDRPFFIYGDERLSFREGYQQAARLGAHLVDALGVEKGDRVAIAMRNYPEWVAAFCAVTSIGAVVVALNAHWRAEELVFALGDCGATVLIADQERYDALRLQRADLPQLRVLVARASRLDDDAEDLGAVVHAPTQVDMPSRTVDPEDDAVIFYTSGSTGRPKGALSTHRNVLSALLSWELEAQVGALTAGLQDVPAAPNPGALLSVPLFHVSGSHAVLLASYRPQRRIVALYKWDVQAAAEAIEREALTSLIAPAAITGDLVRVARSTERDLSSLLAVGGGGAPRAAAQVAEIDAVFANAVAGTSWGMTETNAIGTTLAGPDYLTRPTSSGRVSAVLDIRIVGEDGAPAPPGERGEIEVRGASVFQRYWNRPEVNAEAFRQGWFRTGDVGYLDDEGYLFIVDRSKDLIIRGGENIGCGRVEDVLLRHPQIHEAAVYGVPDDRLGETVGATIWSEPGLREDDVRAFAADHLAFFEIPKNICFAADPLPRTESGKIWKAAIRKSALLQGCA